MEADSEGFPVLLVDDDPQFLLSSGVALRSAGVQPVVTIEDSRNVMRFLEDHGAGVLSMDSFRKATGLEGASVPPADGSGARVSSPFLSSTRLPTLREAEEYLISTALARAKNNQGIAASLLGITRQALNKRLVRGGRAARDTDGAGW